MPELLLEILSEEIPARMQARAAEDLKRLVTGGLEEAGLAFDSARAFATPRRLALVVDGLPAKTPDISEERRGPRADAPDRAVEGFLRGAGITRDQAEIRETGKGSFYFAVIEKKGLPTWEILSPVVADVVENFPWPKSMRWASNDLRWVRPIHSVIALLDGEVVETVIELKKPHNQSTAMRPGKMTVGHRFLAPKPFAVKGFDDYAAKLRDAKVILDAAERREIILEDAARLADEAGLRLKDDPGLADEVAGLVEWPVTYMGRIDGEFMDLPPEVLTTSMRAHQKYFALETKSGALAPNFIVVANTETSDRGEAVVAGNERVLRARLADAKFYWDQDRKASLASRAPALEDVTFHAKLGSLDDKIGRVQALAAEIAGRVPGADTDKARAAARLAKADLTTGMVYEFPELQGIMGRYYALGDGEDPTVADAIRDHYSPLGPSDDCPTAPVSVAVALADKIDTLVGFWAIDEKPTGSRDPYALRRAALGVIRLVLENGLRLPLRQLFKTSYSSVKNSIEDELEPGTSRSPIAEKEYRAGGGSHQLMENLPLIKERPVVEGLLAFFADRLKVHLREVGTRHDLISAVFALGGEDDLVRVIARVSALGGFLETDDGANLLTAYRRAANILRIEEKNDGASFDGAPDTGLFAEPQETKLFEKLAAAEAQIAPNLADERFDQAMNELARLRRSVDDFFDHVTVNCDDPALRVNRLRLLSRIRATMNRVADFSQIEGGER